MPWTAPDPNALQFLARTAQAYARLLAHPEADRALGLGGKLFAAGALDEPGRALVVAANIAGAATLTATAFPTAQKQAVRDGVVDFLVASLDEALRILKNQLRKRETAAVCVAAEPAAIARESGERGLLPDLWRDAVFPVSAPDSLFFHAGAERQAQPTAGIFAVWRTAAARQKDRALLDAIALGCLDAQDWAARRWVQLAPRYLGRLAQGLRLLAADRAFVDSFAAQLRERAARRELAFACELRICADGREEIHRFDDGIF